jgi:hypothetical protein
LPSLVGQISELPVQPPLQKYFASPHTQIRFRTAAVPAHRGAFRDRHKRWAGDAVDAAASAQLGLRPEKRRRTMLVRTAKSCGPDTPTLVSSWWATADDGGKQARSPGSAKETVKTTARGMPGVSGVTVVTNARVYYTPRAAAGALGARHSLRPLNERAEVDGKPRAFQAARSRSCVSTPTPSPGERRGP